jgi:hypothetical protein
MYFSLREKRKAEMDEGLKGSNASAEEWFDAFKDLCEKLQIKVS